MYAHCLLQFSNQQSNRSQMQEASQLATAHYPETLDRIFILGAPSFFPTVWSWIKRWFDPITVSKIFILTPANTYKTLAEYIEPEDIPKKYGGNLDWEWGHLPNLDPEISSALDWKKPVKGENGENGFPVGPIRWQASADRRKLSAIALGSVNGQQRKDEIASISIPEDTAVNRLSSRPQASRAPASTSGEHTHPPEDVETFPKSGDTPTDTPSGSDAQSLSSSKLWNPSNRTVPVQQTDFASKFESQQNPHSATERQDQVRQGTSEMRQDLQSGTHAEGVGSLATPAVVDHGNRDKTNTVEPGTIGQAPKDVTVPEATGGAQAGLKESGYVDQAKTAVSDAAATVGAVGSSVANMVGLGNTEPSQAGSKDKQQSRTEQQQDPKVDKMGDGEIEDFLRTKYASHD